MKEATHSMLRPKGRGCFWTPPQLWTERCFCSEVKCSPWRGTSSKRGPNRMVSVAVEIPTRIPKGDTSQKPEKGRAPSKFTVKHPLVVCPGMWNLKRLVYCSAQHSRSFQHVPGFRACIKGHFESVGVSLVRETKVESRLF